MVNIPSNKKLSFVDTLSEKANQCNFREMDFLFLNDSLDNDEKYHHYALKAKQFDFKVKNGKPVENHEESSLVLCGGGQSSVNFKL
jgi:hypothetical protein